MADSDAALELQQLRRKHAKLQDEFDALREDYEELQANPVVMEREVHETVTEQTQELIEELRYQVQKAQGELKAVQESSASLEGRLSEAQAERASAQAKLASAQTEWDQERDQLKADKADLQRDLAQAESRVTTMTASLEHARDEVDRLRTTSASADADLEARFRRQIEEQAQLLEQARAELQAGGAQDDELRSEVARLREEAARLASKLSAAESDNASLSRDQARLREDLAQATQARGANEAEVRAEIARLRAESSQAFEEAARLTSKLSAAQSDNAKLSAEQSRLREELSRALEVAAATPATNDDVFGEEEEQVVTERVVVIERDVPPNPELLLELDALRAEIFRLEALLAQQGPNPGTTCTCSCSHDVVSELRIYRENIAKLEAELIATRAELHALRLKREDYEALIDRLHLDIDMYRAQLAVSRDLQQRQDTQIQQQQERIAQLQAELSNCNEQELPSLLEALQEIARLRAEMQQAILENYELQQSLAKLAAAALQNQQDQHQQIKDVKELLAKLSSTSSHGCRCSAPCGGKVCKTRYITRHKLCKVSRVAGGGGGGNTSSSSDDEANKPGCGKGCGCGCGGRPLTRGCTCKTSCGTSSSRQNTCTRQLCLTDAKTTVRTTSSKRSRGYGSGSGAYYYPVKAVRSAVVPDGVVEWLRVSTDGVALCDADRNEVVAWPITHIVRYGKDEFVFSFEVGDIAETGQAVIFLQTTYMDNIFDLMETLTN